jgi:hypothetical protein
MVANHIRSTMLRSLVLGLLSLGLTGPSAAEEASIVMRSLAPVIPEASGEQCVADTALMRRDHMKFLTHQRDETVRDGVRTERFSLKGCIDCHAVNGPDAKPVTAESPDHFCRVCHDYAAVRIDCFECHASRPQVARKSEFGAGTQKADIAALAAILEEAER